MAICQSETVNSSLQAPAAAPMPKLGRRAVLAGLAVTSIAGAAVAAEPDEVQTVVSAWREWRKLEMEDVALTPKILAAYNAQPKWVQLPGLEFLDEGHISEDGIDGACVKAPAWMESAIPAMRDAAKRELRERSQRSAAELEHCGYTAMERRSDEIIELTAPLIDRIEVSDSTHPAVMAAKIDLALSRGRRMKDLLDDCPWHALTTILRSILPQLPADMAAMLAPAAEGRGTIGELFGLAAEA
jgi:hypothetical protein